MFFTGCTSVLLSAGFNAVMSELVPAKFHQRDLLELGPVEPRPRDRPVDRRTGDRLRQRVLAFWVNAVSFGAVLVAVVKMNMPPRSAPVNHEPLRQAVLGGFRAMRADPAIANALSVLAVVMGKIDRLSQLSFVVRLGHTDARAHVGRLHEAGQARESATIETRHCPGRRPLDRLTSAHLRLRDPGLAQTSLAIALSMATAEPSTPDPT